ncbi:MAG: hypothetical protein Kow0089_23250 [Desulfobulbaceae bacterium]
METVLMLGDSLIEWGDWETLLPGYGVLNRGIAGETTAGLAARLGYEIERVDDPERVFILSGTNDLLMGDSTFPEIFATMLPRLKMCYPGADIIISGLAPMSMLMKEVEEVNGRLARVAQESGCRYLDLADAFQLHCRPVGNPCFQFDNVHFSPHGYRILAAALENMLKTDPGGPR